MIEQFRGKTEEPALGKEEELPKDKRARSPNAQNERHSESQEPTNETRKIFPETTGGVDVWGEYLERTGNPLMEIIKRQPVPEFNRKTGKFETDWETWDKSVEEEMAMLREIANDMTRSDHLLKDVRLTGDVSADALQLCRSIGAKRGEQRLLNGEAPREVLLGYSALADEMVEKSKQNASLRKAAYTAIEIRRAVDQILSQPVTTKAKDVQEKLADLRRDILQE
jgi:hypothetical protein